jgi:hypothetical protein
VRFVVDFGADLVSALKPGSVLRGLLKCSAKEWFSTFVLLNVVLEMGAVDGLGFFKGRSFSKDFNGVSYSSEEVSYWRAGFCDARSAAMASIASGEKSTKALSVASIAEWLSLSPSDHL